MMVMVMMVMSVMVMSVVVADMEAEVFVAAGVCRGGGQGCYTDGQDRKQAIVESTHGFLLKGFC
jgi:hypothetical protein